MTTRTRKKSVAQQIIELLYPDAQMTTDELNAKIKAKKHTIHTKCLDLFNRGLLEREGEHLWWLREGVTPETLTTGELEDTEGDPAEDPDGGEAGEEEETAPDRAPGRRPPQVRKREGIPLDAQGKFIQELKNVGVQPAGIIPTVASIFFDGDIDSLGWLNQVLLKEAAGFINHRQRRLIISWWSHSRGLPFHEDDFSFAPESEGKGKKAARGEEKEPPAEPAMDAGVGWRIEKDVDGEWVAIPGGAIPTYKEALEAAKQRQVLAAYSKRQTSPAEDNGDDEDEGRPARRGGRRGEPMVEKMMMKLLEGMLDGSKGKASAESEVVARLTDRIEQMERDRNEERMERIEGMVAQALARDPWDDYDRINKMKERLGGGGPVVTDQSPAVQLIKDSTDKMDKNVGRLVGIMERIVLREGDIKLEDTRTPEQREQKAHELLTTVQERGRSRGLRQSAFGV